MTPLVFEVRSAYGNVRFYPACKKSEWILILSGRKCLTKDEIEGLKYAGFDVVIQGGES